MPDILEWMGVIPAAVGVFSTFKSIRDYRIGMRELYRREFGFYPAPHLSTHEMYSAIDMHQRRLKPKPVY